MILLVFRVGHVTRFAHEFFLEREVCGNLRVNLAERFDDSVTACPPAHVVVQRIDQGDQFTVLVVDFSDADAEFVLPLYKAHR